jgi:hypothetical protein
MIGHVTSFFYNLDKTATPLLKIVKDDGIENYLPLKRNKKIEVKKDFGKYCTGYFSNGEFHSCPDNAEIKTGWKCRTCMSKDGYLKCARCTGSYCNASLEIRKNCFEKTHFLYITLIGNKIKVGVTRAGRYLKRWIEQGSDYSCLISSGTGLEVRRKEHILSQEITDKVRTTEKIKLFMKDNKEILQKFLKDKKLEVPIINVRKYYEGIDSIPKKPCVYDGLLNGRIVCVKGKIIVFEKEKEYYYYNINDLISHKVELNYN